MSSFGILFTDSENIFRINNYFTLFALLNPDQIYYMKKFYTLIALLIGIQFSSNAQVKRCSTTEYMDLMRQVSPILEKQMQEDEQALQAKIAAAEASGSNQKVKVVYTIPVVVHVVYKTAIQNISDAQVLSQIDVLNEDFRRMNADTVNTPSYFQSVAADVEFQFCMAHTDPNGNYTTGIERTLTTMNSFGVNSDVKFASSGGANAWNTLQYFNIWVCNLANPYLGFGEFPTSTVTNTYGLVVGYNYFGRVGTLSAPYNKGRTATHEIGHCFNLRHIWGDDGSACTGSDQVSDTPNQADENYSCSAPITISCSNGPNGDMFQNYMDYTDDACMNIFTQGQKTRMRTAVTSWYPSLLTSDKCSSPVSVNENGSGSAAFTMYPNPATEEVVVSYNIVSEGVLRMYDVTGKVVFEENIAAGVSQYRLSLENFSAGTYTLNMISNNMNNTQKLIVTKR